MANEHIKALKQTLKGNAKYGLPILKCLEHSNGKLRATDLTIMTEVETPTIADGIWNATALDLGFKEGTKNKEFTSQDYPTLDPKKPEQIAKLSGDDMAKVLRALEYVSKDTTRPALTGVLISGNKVYASDGYKLFRDTLKEQATTREIILPPQCVNVLKSSKAEKHNWSLTIYEDEVAFKSGGMTIWSKIIEAQAPRYEDLLLGDSRQNYDRVFEVNLKEKIPANHVIRVDKETNRVGLRNEETGEFIELSEATREGNGRLTDTDRREIVMALHTGDDKIIELDPRLVKHFKGKVRFYAKIGGVLEMKEIK